MTNVPEQASVLSGQLSATSSRASSHFEDLADDQVDKVVNVLNAVGLGGLMGGPQVQQPTGKDFLPTGMHKKWQRHFPHGKILQAGRYCFQMGLVTWLVMCVVGSQFFYRRALNSKVLFEAVIDQQDQDAADRTYMKWLEGLFALEEAKEGQYALHSFYIWHITNPREVMTLGYKPNLEQKGPYGYVKHEQKYDVRFSDDDSRTATYRKHMFYRAIESGDACKEMFFRMDKAELRINRPECLEDACFCASDEVDMVTVLNPPFMKLLHELTPAGLLSLLSQETFHAAEEALTTGFPRALKAALLPDLFKSVLTFRKAAALGGVLQELFESLSALQGEGAVVAQFASAGSAAWVDCGDIMITGHSDCPWGTTSYITAAAASGSTLSLTQTEAEVLLSSAPGGLFNFNDGLVKWLGAGTYLNLINDGGLLYTGPLRKDGEVEFQNLVTILCSWDPTTTVEEDCRTKVIGIATWLWSVWFEVTSLDNLVAQEWLGGTDDVACDETGSHCNWQVGLPLSIESARNIIDPAMGDNRNHLSIHTVTGLNEWHDAYLYCSSNHDIRDCGEMESMQVVAQVSLPTDLSTTEASASTSTLQDNVCQIAEHLFGSWVDANAWVDDQTAAYLNVALADKLGGFQLSGSAIGEVGYVQWAGGHITQLLYGVPSIGMVKREGIWRFMPTKLHLSRPELSSWAATAGYPHVNIPVVEAKQVLQHLASDTAEGDTFRKHIISTSTTYRGQGEEFNGELFDEGDVLFVEENPAANFGLDGSLSAVGDMLSQVYLSDAAYCEEIEGVYLSCQQLKTNLKPWPANCEVFQTIISAPATGIECDWERLYANPHPYPKQPGNVLAEMINYYAHQLVLKDEGLICEDPAACDYARGGFFTTRLARDVLFDGYTDPLVMKLLNRRYAGRQLTIQCNERAVKGFTEQCETIYEDDCSQSGFQVLHPDHGIIMRVNRDEARHLWHSVELSLPHNLGSISNPAFAVFPGQTWANETFQKQRSCEKRTLSGPGGLWNSCETVVETGREHSMNISNHLSFYGNTTISATVGGDSMLEVSGGDILQAQANKWEGFDEYILPYHGLRFAGNNVRGNATVHIFDGDNLLLYNMARDGSTDSHFVRYPTVYTYEQNQPPLLNLDVNVRVNRYYAQAQDWLDARERVGNTYLKDFNGMPYSVPVGMVSNQVLTGFPTLMSDPHLYTNSKEGFLHWNQVKNLDPQPQLHRSFVDLDPVTGTLLRTAKRTQLNLRMERSALTPDLISSQDRCHVPTKNNLEGGYGCFMYVPVVWTDDERIIDYNSARRLKEEFWLYPEYLYNTAYYGALGGGALVVVGSLLFGACTIKKRQFLRKAYID